MEKQDTANIMKGRWTFPRIFLLVLSGLFLLYLLIMTYLYFYPALDFTVQLPVNPPAVLEPKQQSLQTHIGAPHLPWGLETIEFLLIPSYHTNFYANVDGGALVEEKAASQPVCNTTATVTCVTVTTPNGQQYLSFITKNSDGTITNKSIYFNRNQTAISVDLTERPRALSREALNAYIDSFQPVHNSFAVNHFTPGP